MKIWKWIVGLLAVFGGAAAVASTQKEKEHDKKVKENQDKIKQVKVKTTKAQQQKAEVKKELVQQKKKVVKAKVQVKDTGNIKKVTKDFEKKYRKPGRPKKQA